MDEIKVRRSYASIDKPLVFARVIGWVGDNRLAYQWVKPVETVSLRGSSFHMRSRDKDNQLFVTTLDNFSQRFRPITREDVDEPTTGR